MKDQVSNGLSIEFIGMEPDGEDIPLATDPQKDELSQQQLDGQSTR